MKSIKLNIIFSNKIQYFFLTSVISTIVLLCVHSGSTVLFCPVAGDNQITMTLVVRYKKNHYILNLGTSVEKKKQFCSTLFLNTLFKFIDASNWRDCKFTTLLSAAKSDGISTARERVVNISCYHSQTFWAIFQATL